MEETATVHDLLAILRRRKWSLILPAVIVFVIALLAVLIISPTYRSTSTILIEEQELPREFVATTISGFAEQRLQMINQRIMSSTRLLEIINRFNLYTEERKSQTTEDVIALMRRYTKFETISADVIDSRTGRPTAATIAFSLAYEGEKPELVQQVAAALASLYLEENLMVREQQTAGAYKFLEDEANILKAQLAEIDAKISAFKGRNVDSLPELFQVNMQVLDRIDRDIDTMTAQLASLKERQSYLQSQLATIPTETADQDRTLLRELKAKLVQLESRFSEQHPDVIKTRAEIAKLEARISAPSGKEKGKNSAMNDNQAYINLSSQLASVETEIDSARAQLKELNIKRDQYRRRIDTSPKVDEVYKSLLTERNNTQLKYDDLIKKSLEARVAQGMEKGQMGERFTLIDPARLPEKPVRPNVPAILLIGLILGIGSGVGFASFKEYTDQSVKSAQELAKALNLPVLASLPDIVTWEEKKLAKEMRRYLLIGIGVAVVLGIIIIHFFVMDLDVLWARVMRRLFI